MPQESSPNTAQEARAEPPEETEPGRGLLAAAKQLVGLGPGRRFEKPVAWLLGRQFIGSLKGSLLYAAFGSKLDPRDWMQAEQETRFFDEWDLKTGAAEDEPFWFDYIADSGDGMKATYSIAYLCMSELHLAGAELRGPTLDRPAFRAGEYETLPRGRFLFVGGDTAYHLSDYMTLAARIQRPFEWAFDDLRQLRGAAFDETPRPIFGIPGNHDYFDQLDGFRRQFRQPPESMSESRPRARHKVGGPQLVLPGFVRAQESSYVALKLPHGWSLWGLDTEVGQLDERQRDFFQSLWERDADNYGARTPPKKLIVATCAPTTVFGKLADPNDEKSADAFAQLLTPSPDSGGRQEPSKPSQPFLPEKNDDGSYDFERSGDWKLDDGQCRLDLSGDVHHYARYWGPKNPDAPAARPDDRGVPAPEAASYASVVSGLGGAFHHPSQTFAGEIREQALYPEEKVSREEVAGRIFKFWNVLTGGSVHVVGFIIAFVIFFAVAVPQSSRQTLNNFFLLKWLDATHLYDVAQAEPITPTISPLPATFDPRVNPDALGRIGITGGGDYQEALEGISVREALTRLGREPVRREGLNVFAPESWTPPDPCAVDQPAYFYVFSPCRARYPWRVAVGETLLWLSLVVIACTFIWRNRIFGSELKKAVVTDEGGESYIQVVSKYRGELGKKPNALLWAIVLLTAALGFVGLFLIQPFRDHITPFGSSMIVLFSIVWAVAATVLAIRYSEHLFVKSFKDPISRLDWVLPGFLIILGVVGVAVGLWSFGGNTLPSLLVSDMLFIAVVTLACVLIFVLAWSVGGDQKLPGGKHRKWLALLGVWHVILQIFLPFLLIRRGTWLTWLLAIILVVLPMWGGEWLMKRDSPKTRRRGLVAAWLVYGLVMLALPYVTTPPLTDALPGATQPFMSPEWSGWRGIWPALLAGVAGAVLCCLWFGWYLAVSLTFHAHNNEVGGAARIERFKQFIRFKLTDDGLTGYVIAVDDPREHGATLRPRLIDVFNLRPKGGATKA